MGNSFVHPKSGQPIPPLATKGFAINITYASSLDDDDWVPPISPAAWISISHQKWVLFYLQKWWLVALSLSLGIGLHDPNDFFT